MPGMMMMMGMSVCVFADDDDDDDDDGGGGGDDDDADRLCNVCTRATILSIACCAGCVTLMVRTCA